MAFGNIAVVDAFVVMEEVRRNIYPVWTGHAILAVGAGDLSFIRSATSCRKSCSASDKGFCFIIYYIA